MVPVDRCRRPPLAARRRARLALAALIALIAACAGGGLATRSGRAPGAPTRVLLFPLNVTVALPSEVESGVDAVSLELRGYLEGRGLAVETLELGAAREAWLRAATAHKADVGAEKMSFEGAASALARQLREAHDFDALLLPWIALRAARLKDGSAAWDGVKRKVDFFALGKSKRARWALAKLQLWVKAPSLQVQGYSPEGEKLFEGIGGLDLVEEAELELTASKIHFDMVPKERIFEDRSHLREGIGIALAPFLPGREPPGP